MPIDHFRLLGVSPSAEPEKVLRALELRLDRHPREGFTDEVLIQRAELLRLSADLLSNQVQREKYEAALLDGALGLELSSNREVAGLILLWEAEAPSEAFHLAIKALQPPQTPALGSGREADLTLLTALSCKAAAIQEQDERHYESAASLLQTGIQLLQRMGKLKDKREELEMYLVELLPYRILDLLSRDLGDQLAHQEGLELLDNFVMQRGGIEGANSESNSCLEQSEFELFFQQIRKFLTVQEQVDIFKTWNKSGSSDAGFLAVMALVAVGFSRRKPERIYEARKYLKNLNIQGLDSMPLLGCMDLLLADIDKAIYRFKESSDNDLTQWLDNYPGEILGALCDYCRDWLRTDVLPGYRDVNPNEVDLEAWFADRDVQAYIGQLDRSSGLGIARAGFSFFTSLSDDTNSEVNSNHEEAIEESNEANKNSYEEENLEDNQSLEKDEFDDSNNYLSSIVSNLNLFGHIFLNLTSKIKSLPKLYYFIIAIFCIGVTVNFVGSRNKNLDQEIETRTQIESEFLLNENSVLRESDLEKETIESEVLLFDLLVSEVPSEEQVRSLIQAWLDAKSRILSGSESDSLKNVARDTLVKSVYKERNKDEKVGEKQIIKANILSMKIVSQTLKRIEVKTRLSYAEKRLDSSGKSISETLIPDLKVTYILGRDKNIWQLVAYISGK